MKTAEQQPSEEQDIETLPRRLCSEIQLFDLCELDRCNFKDGRYCTHADLLARFEALADPEDRPAHGYSEAADDEDEDAACYDEPDEDDEEYSVFDNEDAFEGHPEDEW